MMAHPPATLANQIKFGRFGWLSVSVLPGLGRYTTIMEAIVKTVHGCNKTRPLYHVLIKTHEPY